MHDELLTRFCTPQAPPLTGYDERVLEGAAKAEIPFEGFSLPSYRWGEGKTVLSIHGWGSRASHLALIGRALAKGGFAAFVPDMPAHSSIGFPAKSTSNMFEYCRALSAIAKSAGPVHAIVGHSFGALCGAFVLAGLRAISDFRIEARKLVLISAPPSIGDVLESFCRHDGPSASRYTALKECLERGFDFRVDDYTLVSALRDIKARVLIVHDEDDEEFPIRGIRSIREAVPKTELFITRGSGHSRILGNRAVIVRVKEFLAGAE